jgi:putative membrane protein
MIAGAVPLGLPVFFIPLVVNAYLLTLLVLGDNASRIAVRLPAGIAAILAIDLVLDPAAVSLGFWAYGAGGAFYGVPLSNFAGWVLAATVATLMLDWGFDGAALAERVRACPYALDDLVSFVLLWGVINAAFLNLAPLAVAGVFALALARIGRLDFLPDPPWATGD